ncbi:leucine-rich repeat protein [Treponema saccharophilum]|uniref:BRCT domain protein n=1 Tax=Treponema saccharophilum DSM 2985 TaxID=907348 RepID=H7EL39_9SPIR|nr:leucine-rich repeat protein [Treponema saccharophilum]EIC01764.1 BRCT domain protein [Treponema saccharophilum DSM 2985]BDC97143.1 hypothetical protein TRSA_22420 [Treponema saccharophilum]
MESVCFTGTCWDMPRAELIQKASKKFEVRNSVTKDLDILVCENKNSGSSKLEKAKKNGTRVITYKEFMDMVDDIKDDGVFYIRNGVLKKCSDDNIENVVIPSGVTEIESSAFLFCFHLKSIEIPEGVKDIGWGFDNFSELESVIIHEGTQVIKLKAFENNPSLKSVSLPSSLIEIQSEAFSSCPALTEITFGGTISQWENVDGLENLLQYVPATSVKCSDGEWQKPLVFVEDGVAVKCLDKKTTSIKLDEGVTAISENAFKECASVLSIELPSTLTEIRKGAFDDCKNVEKIVSHSPLFPFNEKTRKLYDATGKTKKVVLSILAGKEEAKKEKIAQVQNVSASAVLESIMSEHKTNAQVVRDDKNAYLQIQTTDGGIELLLVDSKVSKWMQNLPALLDLVATGADSIAIRKFAIERGLEDSSKKFISISKDGCVSWKKKTKPVYLFIPEGVTQIERNAFYRCESLERVVLGDGMKEIDRYAFEYCESLKSVVIPPSLKKIDGFAFAGCHSLEGLTIPNGVEIIESSAFASCRSLESLTIPSSVQNIGYGAFSGCTGLKTLVIEKGVKIIESVAFHDCTSLSEITYTGTVAEWEKIEKGRRWNCEAPAQFVKCSDGEVSIVPKIEEIKTDTYTLKIYDNGIEKCTCTGDTEKLVIGEGITVIEHSAFWECTGIKSVVFPSSLTKIELDAFSNCTALESIVIPDGMKIIDPSAFDGCTSLKSVVLPASLTRIGDKVFRYCSSLNEIIYKGTMEQWKAVSKYFWGNEDMIAKVVHCADGDVEL